MDSNKTIDFIAKKFDLDLNTKSPVKITGVNRRIIAKTLGELEFTLGAEIGVAQGNHSGILFENIPNLKLFCIDIWQPYPNYPEYTNRIERYYKKAVEKLSPYNAVIIKKFSMDALEDIPDASLDFVYIDGAHDFKNAADDICEWTKKVKIGGIVFGHDYINSIETGNKYPVHVKAVVDAYIYSHKISPYFILANDVQDEVFGRDIPGWLFVRQEKDLI